MGIVEWMLTVRAPDCNRAHSSPAGGSRSIENLRHPMHKQRARLRSFRREPALGRRLDGAQKAPLGHHAGLLREAIGPEIDREFPEPFLAQSSDDDYEAVRVRTQKRLNRLEGARIWNAWTAVMIALSLHEQLEREYERYRL